MPLRVLFLDMNSFFASVEQQLRPELRGIAVAVAAMDVDSTSCIAASVEAKRLGVRTGTPVWEARMRGVKIVKGRFTHYIRMHHAILKAVDTCIPVKAVHSIDEVSCRLDARQTDPAAALTLAARVKAAIRKNVGSCLTCSVGLAPNRLLAKVAADMQKPDGLVLLNDDNLPHALYHLKLEDLPGIGRKMLPRLAAGGITTIEELCTLPEERLKKAWGIWGVKWWHWLRGHDVYDEPTHRGMVGNSHVLPPELRTRDGARRMLIRLVHNASTRMRRIHYVANRIDFHISFIGAVKSWRISAPLNQTQDTMAMLEALEQIFPDRLNGTPLKASVTLYHLTHRGAATPSLFTAKQRRQNLAGALDRVNDKFGWDTIHFADMQGMRKGAPTHIAFNHIPELPVGEEEFVWTAD